MNKNSLILKKLINEDFGLDDRSYSNWAKANAHDSLVLDKQKGIFFWNSRGIVGDPLIYLMNARHMTLEEAEEYLKDYENYCQIFVHSVSKETPVTYPELVETFYEAGLKPERRDYWYRRGITDETIDRFRLGWHNGFNTIPIFVDNIFRNFQLRRDTPSKRIFSYYRNIGPLLFNSDILSYCDTVYITEGLTDCLRLAQEGIPVVSQDKGSGSWLPEWFSRFINVKRIFIIYDNDSAGKSGVLKVAKNLGVYKSKVFTFDGRRHKYDVVDFFRDGGTKEELIKIIENESKYCFETVRNIF